MIFDDIEFNRVKLTHIIKTVHGFSSIIEVYIYIYDNTSDKMSHYISKMGLQTLIHVDIEAHYCILI